MRRTLILAALGAMLAGAAAARPFPPGQCTLADDGVATRPGPDRAQLRTLAQPLPQVPPARVGAPDGSFVADVVFSIRPDGSTDDPQVICARPRDAAFTQALLQALSRWRFDRTRGTPPGELKAAYRIVAWRDAPGMEARELGWWATAQHP